MDNIFVVAAWIVGKGRQGRFIRGHSFVVRPPTTNILPHDSYTRYPGVLQYSRGCPTIETLLYNEVLMIFTLDMRTESSHMAAQTLLALGMVQDLAKRSLTCPVRLVLQVNQIFFYDRITATGVLTMTIAYLASHTFVHMAAYRMRSVCMSIVGYLQPGTCINTVCDCQFVASFDTK